MTKMPQLICCKMSSTSSAFLCIRFCCVLFIFSTLLCPAFSSNISKGFSTRLIHRDSPRSPHHNCKATVSDIWKAAYDRSINRHNYIASTLSLSSSSQPSLRTDLPQMAGLYMMKVSIGTPSVDLLLPFDTGSNLIWTQCLPCMNCISNRPVFDPSLSTTYEICDCQSPECINARNSECTEDLWCQYHQSYGDSTSSIGILSSETLAITSSDGSAVSLLGITFGCGNENHFASPLLGSGVAVFGTGPLSLISQVGDVFGWKFSQCLMRHSATEKNDGYLIVGENAMMIGNSTPLATNDPGGGAVFYYLTMEDISVGSTRLGIPPGTFQWNKDGSGGVIIDAGAEYTMLDSVAYEMMETKLMEMIKMDMVETPENENLCYKGSLGDLLRGDKVPVITLHFVGLDVQVSPANAFAMQSDGVLCLAMQPSQHDLSLIGSYVQQNMNVGFDLGTMSFTFAPTTC